MTLDEHETRFRTHPITSWGSAAVIGAITLAYLTSLGVRAHQISVNELFIPLFLVPTFMGCAYWLATRPSFSIAIDRKNNLLNAVQTWPFQRLLQSVPFDNIASIDVAEDSNNDGSSYLAVVTTKSGEALPISADFFTKRAATAFVDGLRNALKI